MIKRFFYWVDECWNNVMNAKYNPLRFIPDPSINLTLCWYCLPCGVLTLVLWLSFIWVGWVMIL